MPCNTIQTATVELGKAQPGLLMAALNSLGLNARRHGFNQNVILFGQNERYDATTGELTMETMRDVAEIKRAYSHQVVQSQSKKFGWQMKQVGDKYVVQRR